MSWREDAARNTEHWTRNNAEYTAARALSSWREEIHWGIWHLPEDQLNVLSEYSASIWVDPYRWIPEASRLLRSGGRLIFLRNSLLAILCSSDDVNAKVQERLERPQFGMNRITAWDGVEFHLPHGDWIRLLRANGFDIEDLIEIQAPPDAKTNMRYDYVTADWGRRWPAEEIWVARKR